LSLERLKPETRSPESENQKDNKAGEELIRLSKTTLPDNYMTALIRDKMIT